MRRPAPRAWISRIKTTWGARSGYSQSVKTTESGGPRGYDAGKKVKGRKRHILTDTQGNLVHAVIHTANIQDRDGAPMVLAEILHRFPWLRHIFADGGYAGDKLMDALRRRGLIDDGPPQEDGSLLQLTARLA